MIQSSQDLMARTKNLVKSNLVLVDGVNLHRRGGDGISDEIYLGVVGSDDTNIFLHNSTT